MIAYISQKEADELCSGMLCDYFANLKPTDIQVCIDIITCSHVDKPVAVGYNTVSTVVN